jgi:hypothetical protein
MRNLEKLEATRSDQLAFVQRPLQLQRLLRGDGAILLSSLGKHLVHSIDLDLHLLQRFVLFLEAPVVDGCMLALHGRQGVVGWLSGEEVSLGGNDVLKLVDLAEERGDALIRFAHDVVKEEGCLAYAERCVGVDSRLTPLLLLLSAKIGLVLAILRHRRSFFEEEGEEWLGRKIWTPEFLRGRGGSFAEGDKMTRQGKDEGETRRENWIWNSSR